MVANDSFEQKHWKSGKALIAGNDESGMGCLAGDVFSAIVVFSPDIDYKTLLPGLNDSKQKTAEQREVLYKLIQQYALYYAVGSASVEEINRLNVFWARWEAAKRALAMIPVKPDHILIDGDKVMKDYDVPQTAIVKGDGKSISIAAASILAKVERDRHIDALAPLVHPDFNWLENKSYWTPQHVKALQKHGKTVYHREKYANTVLSKLK